MMKRPAARVAANSAVRRVRRRPAVACPDVEPEMASEVEVQEESIAKKPAAQRRTSRKLTADPVSHPLEMDEAFALLAASMPGPDLAPMRQPDDGDLQAMLPAADSVRFDGQSLGHTFSCGAFSAMPEPARDRLLTKWLNRKGKRLLVSTLCSGTEAPMLAMKNDAAMLNALVATEIKEGGAPVAIHQTLACEIEPEKRKFLASISSPPLVFHDAEEIATAVRP